jgi:acetyl esterase/lipase
MPSAESDAPYDYLPASASLARLPPCEIWPTDPPRATLFCEGSALCHPFVSPLAAESWAGSPPIFVICGEERLTDECKAFVQTAAKQGRRVVWEQYEAMPHCFALLLDGTAAAAMSFNSLSEFVRRAVHSPEAIVTGGEFITAKSLVRQSVDVCNLIDVGHEHILARMRNSGQKIIERAAAAS